MTEAIASVNDFAFCTLGVESFYVSNAVSNVASRRVKQKTGAEFVGLHRAPASQWPDEIGKMESGPA